MLTCSISLAWSVHRPVLISSLSLHAVTKLMKLPHLSKANLKALSSPCSWHEALQFCIFSSGCVRAKSLQSCLTVCDPMDCSPPGSSAHGDSPGKNTGVGCHALQGILPTQGSNQCLLKLLHCSGFFTAEPLGSPLFG